MEYKIIEIDTTKFGNSTTKQFEKYTSDGWTIHTAYPMAVGIFLMEKSQPKPIYAVVDMNYGTVKKIN
tara:strand:+ start:3059 stop:3262 length:204 start_codon:yes stop_codon:yes gene_type:complete